jgi:hypothetical protein
VVQRCRPLVRRVQSAAGLPTRRQIRHCVVAKASLRIFFRLPLILRFVPCPGARYGADGGDCGNHGNGLGFPSKTSTEVVAASSASEWSDQHCWHSRLLRAEPVRHRYRTDPSMANMDTRPDQWTYRGLRGCRSAYHLDRGSSPTMTSALRDAGIGVDCRRQGDDHPEVATVAYEAD